MNPPSRSAVGPVDAATLFRRLHDALTMLLVGLRPMIFSGEGGRPDTLAWMVFVTAGLCLCVVESLVGRRERWVWAPGGLGAALLAILLVPALALGPVANEGWASWGGWFMNLAFAAYLIQVLPGRERLAAAALGAGLCAVSALALVQAGVVLPAIGRAVDSGSAQAAGVLQTFSKELVQERIANGGVYATFGLANILALFLLIAGLMVAGSMTTAVRRLSSAHPAAVATGGCVLVAAAVALFFCRTKGAPVACALAGAWVAWRWGRGIWRWAPAGLALATIGLILGLPGLRQAVLDSLTVRLGYWDAALRIAAEHPLLGAGLGGFDLQAGRFLADGGFSRFVHNEPLEAAACAGFPAALVLTALLGWWFWRRPHAEPQEPSPAAALPRALPWLFVFVVPYGGLLGMLATDNLAWWPGGEFLGPRMLWCLGIGTLMGLCMTALLRLPAPPAWALHWALATAALACLIDYHLHDSALLGSLVVLACLAASPGRSLCPSVWAHRVAAVVSSMMVLGLIWAVTRAIAIERGRETVELLEQHQHLLAEDQTGEAERLLALLAGRPPRVEGEPPLDRLGIIQQAWRQGMERLTAWPPAPKLALRLAVLHPVDSRRLDAVERAAQDLPGSQASWSLLADCQWQAGRLDDAIANCRKALALAPHSRACATHLADVLEARAGDLLDKKRVQRLLDEAAQLRESPQVPPCAGQGRDPG